MLRQPRRPARGFGFLWGVAFGAVFALAGAATFHEGVIAPHLQRRAAAGWTATTCTITEATVLARRDDGDQLYASRIEYAYQVDGVRRQGTRVSFGTTVWSSDRGAAQGAAARFAVGQEVACFYDPDEPTEVVLERTVPGAPVVGLLGLGFVLIGLGIAASAVRDERVARRRARAAAPTAGAPLTRLGAHGAGNLMLLGGAAALVTAPVPLMAMGDLTRWTTALFTLVIGGFALLLQGWFWHRMLRAIGPRIDLRVAGAPRLGGEVTITIDVRGWMPIRTARARLIGREEASHRVGTDTVTDVEVFFEAPLATVTRPGRAARLERTLRLPADKVPSFAGASNHVRWVIALDADIATWPDVAEEHELQVAPAEDDAEEARDG